MQRRQFLTSTLPAVALAHAGLYGRCSQNQFHASDAPVGNAYDLVVIGGSLSGCFAALHAAGLGSKVLLVERRTFLGAEITATLRPWLRREGLAEFCKELGDLFLPDQEQAEVGVPFDPSGPPTSFGDDVPLFMGTVKKQLMQALLQSRVDVLVGTGVWGVLTDEEQQVAAGLALASKFGLHTVQCRHILDARDSQSASTSQRRNPVSYSVELYGVAPDIGPEVAAPSSLGLVDDKVFVHSGKRKLGQCFIEFGFIPTREAVEDEARQRTETVCAHLIKKQNGFTGASIRQMAWETFPATSDGTSPADRTCANYHCLPSRASFDLSCQDVLDAYQEARERIDGIRSVGERHIQPSFIDCASGKIPLSQCQATPIDDLSPNLAMQQIQFPYERYLPKVLRADVIIAGGGTAGAMAAMGSVQEGAKTATVEFLPELGGTSTVGRVTGYYAGYKETEFFEMIEDGVSRQSPLAGRCTRGVARMLHYRKQATQAGGKLLTNCITCGVVKNGRKVTGLVVERAGQLCIVTGDVVIDATGDGDVAAFAGAEFEVGNHRMQCTQNYSQWDVNPGVSSWKDSSTNRDHDIIWSHLLSEWQRGYQLSHQQAHYYDFTPLLTVREARRIAGDYTITLVDVMLERRHPDTICMAQSDFDPHHFGDTVFTRVGCLLPHQFSSVVAIPYRALLPRGIDNLLVSAKAISQTHNALQFTRMSFDIMTLGYVTGRIGAMVARQGIKPRDFDVTALQNELRDLKIIPSSPLPEWAVSGERGSSITPHIEAMKAGEPNGLLKIMMHPAEVAKPALRQAYEHADRQEQKLLLAKALAWFGTPVGNKLIAGELKGLFAEEQASGKLPREYYREDKGTPYWTINQDIVLLALSGEASVLADILALTDSLKLDNPHVKQETVYNQGRIDLRLVPHYNRMISICFALERMPHAKATKSLNRLLDDPFIRDCVARLPEEAGSEVYGGILESRLAATLARCGARRGFEVLVEYLEDAHPMLAHYAGQELKSILHVDFGYDYQQWKQHIDRVAFPVAPTPRLSRNEI